MRAKSKKNNKVYDVQVHVRNQDDVPISYCTTKFDKYFLSEDLDFNVEEDNKKLVQSIDYWFKYRAETARMLLSSFIALPGFYSKYSRKVIIETSFNITDELIKQLSSNV